MVKSIISLSVDSEVYQDLKIKYPRGISRLVNDYLKDILELDNKNNENYDKDIEQLEDETEQDETELKEIEQKIREQKEKLKLKKETLNFKKQEYIKHSLEENERKENIINSIKASGIISDMLDQAERGHKPKQREQNDRE